MKKKLIKILIIPGGEIYPAYFGGAVAQTCFLNEYCKQFETHMFLTSVNVSVDHIVQFKNDYPDLRVHYTDLSPSSHIIDFKSNAKKNDIENSSKSDFIV